MPKPPKNPKVGGKQDAASPDILKRQFYPDELNTRWAGDISYIYTATGWTYLAVVLDLSTRKVVGWAYSRIPDAQLAIRALRVAVESRTPAPAPAQGLLFHSDQGCQYTAKIFLDYLASEHIVQSMSRRGYCWDTQYIILPTSYCSDPCWDWLKCLCVDLSININVNRVFPGPELVT